MNGNTARGNHQTWHPRRWEQYTIRLRVHSEGKGLDLVSLLKASTWIMLSTEKINRSSATCSLSLMTTTTLSTVPYPDCKTINSPCPDRNDAHELKFFSDSFHSSGDIRVESRMPGLEDGCIILLTTDEQICGVYLSHIQDSMHRDFNYNSIRFVFRTWLEIKPTEFCDTMNSLWSPSYYAIDIDLNDAYDWKWEAYQTSLYISSGMKKDSELGSTSEGQELSRSRDE
jgi:hypothetical protein